ncbi:MAG: hypothetical protein V1808_03235 [Candidatus Daviesbacteria bacterium]
MISQVIIHPDLSYRQAEAEKILDQNNLSKKHPDLLWFEEEKLGIGEARKIQEFLSLKPYQGNAQAVVLLAAENLSLEAQNALLKTLEEPPAQAIIILGISTEDQLLPTIISRCQVINLQNILTLTLTPEVRVNYQKEIEKLLDLTTEERFKFIEKLEDRENFLHALTAYFRNKLLDKSAGALSIHPRGGNTEFLKNLLEAEKWAAQNVNIRAILEYLMLKMPSREKEPD